jgi:hypothetical protein
MLCCPRNHQLSFFFFIQLSFIHPFACDAPIGISDVNYAFLHLEPPPPLIFLFHPIFILPSIRFWCYIIYEFITSLQKELLKTIGWLQIWGTKSYFYHQKKLLFDIPHIPSN